MKTALHAFEAELDAIREAGTWREERSSSLLIVPVMLYNPKVAHELPNGCWTRPRWACKVVA